MSQGAKPRRLIITIALLPLARTSPSASSVAGCRGPPRGSVSRMSRTSTGGIGRPSTRRGSSSARQLEPGLRPRRRRAGDQHRAALARPPAGDGAGVVAGVAVLLVGGVVLLVDDEQAEVGERREDRRAGADADARLAAAQPAPLVVALAVGEGRVQDRDAVAEPGPEAGHGLRREADLGDEDDRRPAPGQHRLDRGQVDLGLARAGDPVQEQLALGAGDPVDRRDDLRGGALLLGKQPRPARRPRPRRGGSGRAACASCGSRSAHAPPAGAGPGGRRRPPRRAPRPTSRRPRAAPPASPAA